MSNTEQVSPARKRSNANLKRLKKGVSGNPKGRPVGKTLRVLLREVAESERLAVIRKMYLLAKAGDVRAAQWIAVHGDAAALEITTREFTVALSHPDDVTDD